MDQIPELEAAIRRLQADYWARVDERDPDPPDALFTEDCIFELGSLVLRGREQVRDFFLRRREASAASGRTTRHLSADLRLRRVGEREVEASTTVLVMSGYGALPAAACMPSIGDFEDVCVLDDGRWRFHRRKATSVFAGSDAPAFAQSSSQQEGRQA